MEDQTSLPDYKQTWARGTIRNGVCVPDRNEKGGFVIISNDEFQKPLTFPFLPTKRPNPDAQWIT